MNLELYHSAYTVEDAEREMVNAEWSTVERVVPREIDQICQSRNISRRRFLQTLAFPRPSYIQNLVFSSEVRRRFGDVSDVPGFERSGIFAVSKGYGLYVPIKKQAEIVELRFYPMRELIREKVAQ